MGIKTGKITYCCSETPNAVHSIPSHEIKVRFWGAVRVHKMLGPIFLNKP
jgi:hypothetical protein